MSSDALYMNYLDSRGQMRCTAIPCFVASKLHIIKDWKGFHDTCNDMLDKVFWKELTMKQQQQVEPHPTGYCTWAPPRWYFTACDHSNFRREPQLTPNFVDFLVAWWCEQSSIILNSKKISGPESSSVAEVWKGLCWPQMKVGQAWNCID